MPLTSSIVPYDPQWPKRFEEEAARLTRVFGSALVEIHHVGSTAVPELSAKPEIDVLAVVNDSNISMASHRSLQHIGYRRGGDLSAGHLFFKRDVDGVRTHKIHVCLEGHPKISEMLKFRDHLRANRETRLQYQSLKIKLEKTNIRGITEYLEGKGPFIESVLSDID